MGAAELTNGLSIPTVNETLTRSGSTTRECEPLARDFIASCSNARGCICVFSKGASSFPGDDDKIQPTCEKIKDTGLCNAVPSAEGFRLHDI
jgi:hypothetical protein